MLPTLYDLVVAKIREHISCRNAENFSHLQQIAGQGKQNHLSQVFMSVDFITLASLTLSRYHSHFVSHNHISEVGVNTEHRLYFTQIIQIIIPKSGSLSNNYPLYTVLLSCSRWIGNPINHSSTTMSASPSCLSAHVFNHIRFSESN